MNLRVLDRTTKKFLQTMAFRLSKYAISDFKDNQISACSDDELLFDRFEVHKLKSIWIIDIELFHFLISTHNGK